MCLPVGPKGGVGKRARREGPQLLLIKDSDPQQLKDIFNGFNLTWTEEHFIRLLNRWETDKLADQKRQVVAQTSKGYAASTSTTLSLRLQSSRTKVVT